MEEAVKLLKDILEIPSVNGRDDEGAVAEYLSEYFRKHQIQSRVRRIDETHANVTAFLPGRDRSRTEVWNGHIDTVPYGDLEKWHTDPAAPVEREGRIYARGASDMKSGAAAMVYALTHLPDLPAHNIFFAGTCDEEKKGLGAAELLKEEDLPDYDFLLIGEPTDLRLGVAHKGCLWLKITLKGKTGHGAYPEKGVNAIHYAYRLGEALIRYVYGFSHPLLGTSTAQIDQIRGGVAPNMTADSCEAVLDIRMTPGLTTEMILEKAREILEELRKEAPELSAEFEKLNDRRAFSIPETEPHVRRLRELLQEAGCPATDIGINFFTDASVLAASDLEKQVLLFGPGDPVMAHQPDEYVELEKYLQAVELLKKLAVSKTE